ncbi:DNA ligase (ATP) [Homalodisca vitripennis]|nr:DNA ligase (ATP) [Homalodisca vitripennis]
MASEENSNISVEEEALQDQSDVDCALALAQLARTIKGGEQVNDENINEWMNCDADDPGYELLSDEDIINKAQGVEEEIYNNEEEEMPPQSRVSHESALQHVERLIEYLEGEDFGTVADDLTLRKTTYCVIVGKENIRVTNVCKAGTYNVVRAQWLLHSLDAGQLLEWTPADVVSATPETKDQLEQHYDQYGDSFTQPATLHSIQHVLPQVVSVEL